MSKKKQVLVELFQRCVARDNYEFNNDEVEAVCRKIGF